MERGRPSEEANRELKQKMGWLRVVIVQMAVYRFSDRILTVLTLSPFTTYMLSGKLLKFFEPQFPYLAML